MYPDFLMMSVMQWRSQDLEVEWAQPVWATEVPSGVPGQSPSGSQSAQSAADSRIFQATQNVD